MPFNLSSLESKSTKTTLDLELDLQASKARLQRLGDDVHQLKTIRTMMAEAQQEGW